MKKRWIFLAFLASLVIALLWQRVDAISNFGHSLLDPVFGRLLDWNIFWGMSIIVVILSIIMTLIQKYGVDQEALKEIKKEQKKLQEDMKKYKEHPDKLMEFNQKQIEIMGRMFRISMGSVVYTAIPFVIFFRWFYDYFAVVDYQFFGFLSWFWFYLIVSIILSSIFRKVFKVA